MIFFDITIFSQETTKSVFRVVVTGAISVVIIAMLTNVAVAVLC